MVRECEDHQAADRPGSGQAVVGRFLEMYLADVAAGRERPLVHYQSVFPGFEAQIEAEFRGLAGGDDGGLRIGRYCVRREIGRGGQGTVYLARDEVVGRDVALKTLSGAFRAAPAAVLRFRREVDALARIDHPAICAVLDASFDGVVPWVAMRHVEGRPLCDLIGAAVAAGAAMPEIPPAKGAALGERLDAILRLVERIALGVEAAHRAGVIHRDLKPGNVMITPSGEPVVLDFGLAHIDDQTGAALTGTSDVFGTPAYMAPEQIDPRRGQVDRRTDVYALGVLLYECVTLRRPFDEPTREALFRSVLESDPFDPSSVRREISRDLAAVMLAAVDKDPARRYQTAAAFADDLARAREHRPIAARRAGPIRRLARFAERNRGLAAALGALFFVLLASLALALYGLDREAGRSREIRRLADRKRIDDLLEAARSIEPVEPACIDAANGAAAWLGATDAVLARRTEYVDALAEVRQRRRPLSADEAGARRGRVEAVRSAARERLIRHVGFVESMREAQLPEDHWRSIGLRAEGRAIEATIADPEAAMTGSFVDPDDAWLESALLELLERLEALAAERHRIEAAVRRARLLPTGSAVDAAWEGAIAAASEAPYRGVVLIREPDLMPLGRDPTSGLLEFADLRTGAPPERRASGELIVEPSTGVVFVLLPGGKTTIGATRRDDGAPHSDPLALAIEAPPIAVELDAYLISKFEFTQAQWTRVTGDQPAAFRCSWVTAGKKVTAMNPVESVTVGEAAAALGRVGMMLPTEAQWEYAARGARTTPWWFGSDRSTVGRYANVADRSFAREFEPRVALTETQADDGWVRHAPVGSFLPNGFGLFDVAGNVDEWCRDDAFLTLDEAPRRPGDGACTEGHADKRAVRGGSWAEDAASARSAARRVIQSGYRGGDVGFRPIRRLRRS